MKDIFSRRQFLAAGALTSAALPLAGLAAGSSKPQLDPLAPPPHPGTWLRWLDGAAPALHTGVTWGMPWPRGRVRRDAQFALRRDGHDVGVQSWPLAYWPDGSVKWSAHALPPTASFSEDVVELVPVRRASVVAGPALAIKDGADAIDIDTGVLQCRVPKTGATLIHSLVRNGRETLRDGRLIALRQDAPAVESGAIAHEAFDSAIDRVSIENRGTTRATIRIEGRHAHADRRWLPFTLRLYFYAGGDSVRVVHTFIFDGDESKDFIRGLGIRFAVPLSDPLHDRHVRFSGEGSGVFAEAVRGLTGLRRDPGAEARNAQLAGKATPPVERFASKVGEGLGLVPAFGDWTLFQSSADSFAITKRTKDGHAWLEAGHGNRCDGLGYVGGPSGGVAFGLKNFWQTHPAQLDIRGATEAAAEVTMWMWAPRAPAMDLRFYHDGMGQDTYEEQITGLEITYEDYEPGFGTAMGVARTSEIQLWALPSTPSREQFVVLKEVLRAPPVIVPTPSTLSNAGVFAQGFSLASRATPQRAAIEDKLDWLFEFYVGQREQHHWYGFWNYGDVMHTYDSDRHVWRYDVGGYAWDNSELSTDIWLWLYFLRTGRADVFRFAEAMTRHTGEVDVHHLGRFAPLGSRHNVMHWGCSAKQLRISTALNRRYYYYLTGDERVGDLMREQVEAARTLRTIVAERKLPEAKQRPASSRDDDHAWLSFGTDWGSLAGAWLTEWERTGDRRTRNRLLASMKSIGTQPRGFLTGGGRMQLESGAFDRATTDAISVSHLSAAFGLPEVCAELIDLLPQPEFERAWLQYCELYNASPEEQKRAIGENFGALNLGQGHARLTAYAAHRRNDPALAQRAWQEFYAGRAGYRASQEYATQRVEGPVVLNPVDEAAWVSTNSTAQWGLAAIECLAYAGEPKT